MAKATPIHSQLLAGYIDYRHILLKAARQLIKQTIDEQGGTHLETQFQLEDGTLGPVEIITEEGMGTLVDNQVVIGMKLDDMPSVSVLAIIQALESQ